MVEVWRVKMRYRCQFAKVVVDRVTTASVFLKGNRVAKHSDGVSYFDDFDSAKHFAKTVLKQSQERAKFHLEEAEDNLQWIEKVTADTAPVSTNLY